MSAVGDPRAVVTAAVGHTIDGSARISVRASLPFAFLPDGEFRGVVDFASDRCQLTGPGRLVLDGPATYTQLDDGRWTHQDGPPGTWALLHPRGALEGLRRACITAVARGERRFSIELDRDALDEIAALGLAAAWTVSACVALDEKQRIRNLDLTFSDPSEPDGSMRVIFEFENFGDPVSIDLPPASSTIPLADHIAEICDAPSGPG